MQSIRGVHINKKHGLKIIREIVNSTKKSNSAGI